MSNRKIHKLSGLIAGIVIFILFFTGLFLNHDNWKFLHNITFEMVPSNIYKYNSKNLNSFWINPSNSNHINIASQRGVFESFDNGKTYKKNLDEITSSIKSHKTFLYASTSRGLYKKEIGSTLWKIYLLEGKVVSSINIYKDKLLAVIDKSEIVLIDLNENTKILSSVINIEEENLNKDIKLSRFVRDLHYGRGLFDGNFSLYINDYASIICTLLFISSLFLWWFIKNVKNNHEHAKKIKIFVKIHSNIFVIVCIIPVLILIITGIFLDHGKGLRSVMNNTTISSTFLPPVYKTLRHDIWGADFDGGYFYIGNRYGVYKSKELKSFSLVSSGFAYKMIRDNETLYVSGMGSANRILKDKKWEFLKNAPHMFKDVFIKDSKVQYFSSHGNKGINLPKFEDVSLYTLFLSLHDGSYFASWWVWINDIASIFLLILFVTGIIRWYLRSHLRKKINNIKG